MRTARVVMACALPLLPVAGSFAMAQPFPGFSCTIGGASLSSTAPPNVFVGRVPPQPIPSGFHQAIDDVPASEPLTIVVQGAASSPSAPGKQLQATFAIRGVTKNLLAKLPLTAAVEVPGRGPSRIPTATVRLTYGSTAYEGARGQIVIEAIDFAASTVRGTFNLTTGQSFDQQAPIQLTNGRFER
jgi:hypothetical protein